MSDTEPQRQPQPDDDDEHVDGSLPPESDEDDASPGEAFPGTDGMAGPQPTS